VWPDASLPLRESHHGWNGQLREPYGGRQRAERGKIRAAEKARYIHTRPVDGESRHRRANARFFVQSNFRAPKIALRIGGPLINRIRIRRHDQGRIRRRRARPILHQHRRIH